MSLNQLINGDCPAFKLKQGGLAAQCGQATCAGRTATISSSACTADSIIVLTMAEATGAAAITSLHAVAGSGSFVITYVGGDAATYKVNWAILG